jgi:hypothetical protein
MEDVERYDYEVYILSSSEKLAFENSQFNAVFIQLGDKNNIQPDDIF